MEIKIMTKEEYFEMRIKRNLLRDEHDNLTGREAGKKAKEIKELDKQLELHEWSNPQDQDEFLTISK